MPTYVVQPHDTLSKIARRLGLRSWRDLSGYRSGNPNRIFPGEVLTYRSSTHVAAPARHGMAVDREAEGQATSWANPAGLPQVEGLVAQIYFPFDSAALDANDRSELQKLQHLSIMMLAHPVHLNCVGYTDHRGSITYNEGLSRRRARAVCGVLDQMLGALRNYSSSIDPKGATLSMWPMPSRLQMQTDRRVDVFSSRLPARIVRVPETHIQGRTLPEVRYREIQQNIDAPQWGLGDDFPDHPMEALPELERHANDASLDFAIRRALNDVTPEVRWRFMDHATGGILVVVAVLVRSDQNATRQSFRSTEIVQGVFAQPAHAISVWQHQDHMATEGVQYRYYWFTRRRSRSQGGRV